MLVSFKFNYISYTIDNIDCFNLFTLYDRLIYMRTLFIT